MTVLNDNQKQRIAALLNAREAELIGILRASGSHAASLDAHEVEDLKDMAEQRANEVVDDAQSEHAAQELQQVLAARRRLAGDDFGVCLDCGQPIALQRLLLLPAASLCAGCQGQRESARPH